MGEVTSLTSSGMESARRAQVPSSSPWVNNAKREMRGREKKTDESLFLLGHTIDLWKKKMKIKFFSAAAPPPPPCSSAMMGEGGGAKKKMRRKLISEKLAIMKKKKKRK